jgi:hypothetical protein
MESFEFPLRLKLNVFTCALFQSPLYFKMIIHKLRFARKEIRLEVNAEKTKHLVTSGEQKEDKISISRLLINPLKGWNS